MAMDADVRLLIGVARGGADGDSEALIRKELNEIMGKIKLEAKLDSKSFGEQIRKQLDAISKNGKFYVNLSKINIGAGAIADFRRQLNTVINTLNLDKGTSITLTAEGIGEVKSKIKETATVTDEAARKMAEFNVQIAAMKKQSKNIDTGLGSLSKGATAEEAAQVTALLERYKAWQVEFETLRLQGVDGSNERRKALEDEAAAILVNIQRINEEREATAEAAQAKVQAEREAKAADDATVTAENRKNAAMKQGVMLLTQMQKRSRIGLLRKADGAANTIITFGRVPCTCKNILVSLSVEKFLLMNSNAGLLVCGHLLLSHQMPLRVPVKILRH